MMLARLAPPVSENQSTLRESDTAENGQGLTKVQLAKDPTPITNDKLVIPDEYRDFAWLFEDEELESSLPDRARGITKYL